MLPSLTPASLALGMAISCWPWLKAQVPTVTDEVDRARQVDDMVREMGHHRHVHWLAQTGDTVRFATVALSASKSVPIDEQTFSATASVVEIRTLGGEVEIRTELDFKVLQPFTWNTRRAWHLFELGDLTVVAALDAAQGLLHILNADTGAPVLPAQPALALLDARTVAQGFEVLVLSAKGHLRQVAVTADGGSLTSLAVETGLDVVGAASFADAGGAEHRSGEAVSPNARIWAAGWVGPDFGVAESGERGLEPRLHVPRLAVMPPRGSRLRLAWTAGEERAWVAVGQPGYRHGVGRLAVFEARGPNLALLHEGRPGAEMVHDFLDQRDFGHALVFVPDADADGLPDLVVTSPSASIILAQQLDLISSASGALLERWEPKNFDSAGHSIDLAPDGRRLLVGGTAQRSYPENLKHVGVVTVLELNGLTPVAEHRQSSTLR